MLNEFRESLHLPLHLPDLLAHVQYDFDAGEVDAHLASEGQNHFQPFEVGIRVETSIALRSRGLEEPYALVEPQRLRVQAIELGYRADHISRAALFFGRSDGHKIGRASCRERVEMMV